MTSRSWPALLILPPITLVIGLVMAAVITYMMPTQYESTAIIEIQDRSTQLHIPTEMAKLTTSEHLSFASRDLDMVTRDGISHEESIGMLRRHLRITQIPGTDLIQIRARHPSRETARDIAAAIIRASDSIRNQLHQAEFQQQRKALETALAEQEQRVLELRQAAAGDTPHSPHAHIEAPSDAELLHQQENDVFMQLKTQAATIYHPEFNQPPHQIIVHAQPVIADRPVSPNVPLNLILGATSGLLLGFPLALLVMALRK